MKIVFIRHGEPDYSYVAYKGFIGHGIDLAHLTNEGEKQARKAAENSKLNGIELILSSPYTRALQTAAIISRHRNIEIKIELDLHEWLPDLTYTFSTEDAVIQAVELLISNKGLCPANSYVQYEELSGVFERANKCLLKYVSYDKIAVVAHSTLIRQFNYNKRLPFCGISEVEYDENYQWCGWVDSII